MPRLILKCPYFKGSKSAPHLSHLVRYIATREGVETIPENHRQHPAGAEQRKQVQQIISDFPNTVSLFEYEDYLAAPTLGNASDFIGIALEHNVEQLTRREIYMKYIATRPRVHKTGPHGLFSESDNPLVLTHIANEVSYHAGNVWTPIISMRREDAERLGFDNARSWRDLLMAKSAEIADSMKIHPDHFKWYAAFHNESHHPHIHMVCYSSDPREGFLTREGITQMKSCLVRDIFRNELNAVYAEQSKRRDVLGQEAHVVIKQLVHQMKSGVLYNESIERLMMHLADRLQYHSGKRQYGYLKAPLKSVVDEIIDELAKDARVAEAYRSWYVMRNEVLRTYQDMLPEPLPLSKQNEFKSIRNMVIAEAVGIMGHTFTFEDEGITDEPEPEEAHETQEVWKQAKQYRLAKNTIYDEDATFEQRDTALLLIERLHAEGFTVAAHLIGKLYRDGIFVLRDATVAEKWFRLSADAGNDYSEYALGKLLFDQKRIEEGISWLEKAARQSNQYARYRLGKVYLSGEDVPKNVLKALEYLTTSAEQGNQYAQYTLGKLYLMGIEIQRDRESAVHWLTLSAAQGNQYAQFFLDNLNRFRNPSAFLAATRLLHQMGRIFADNAPTGKHSGGIQLDRKLLRKLKAKKIAQGHKRDDHEQEGNQNTTLTM